MKCETPDPLPQLRTCHAFLVDLTTRIASGALTPADALALTRDAIAAREGEVAAFVRGVDDMRPAPGPLTGIAVALKDIIDTADMPTEMGSALYEGWRPRADAPVVAALRRAGATIAGKTTTTPFATLDPTRTPQSPPCRPHAGRLVGRLRGRGRCRHGAVGARDADGRLGDPAGFVLRRRGDQALLPADSRPSASRRSPGRWTRSGCSRLAWRMSRSPLELLTGRPAGAGGSAAPRLGLVRQDFAGPAEPDGEAALEQAAAAVSLAGGHVVEVAPPPSLAEAWTVHPLIQDFEAATSLAWEYDSARDRCRRSFARASTRGAAWRRPLTTTRDASPTARDATPASYSGTSTRS